MGTKLFALLALLAVAAASPVHPTAAGKLLFWCHPETLSGTENAFITQWNDGHTNGNHLKIFGRIHHNCLNSYPGVAIESPIFFPPNSTVVAVVSAGHWQIMDHVPTPCTVVEIACFQGQADTAKFKAHLKNKYALP